MTQMEAHSGPLLAGTQAATAHVASEKTLYVAYALRGTYGDWLSVAAVAGRQKSLDNGGDFGGSSRAAGVAENERLLHISNPSEEAM